MRLYIGYDVSLGTQAFGYQTVQSGIELGEFMADSKYGLAYIEDVIRYNRFNSVSLNKAVTAGSPTPTLNCEDLFRMEGFYPFIASGAVDMIHPDLLTSGGMIETKRIADCADRFGIKTMIHAAASPIGQIAKVHCAATIRKFVAIEYQYRWLRMPWWEDLVDGLEKPIIQPGGVIPVPDGPGLGIEFNEEVAKEYLLECKYLPYDPGLFEPTPEFDKPMLKLEAQEKGLIGYNHLHKAGPWPWWHLDENLNYGYHMRGS